MLVSAAPSYLYALLCSTCNSTLGHRKSIENNREHKN